MGSIIGFIFLCLFIFTLSCFLGGLPFIVWIILVEIAGLDDYMWALTLIAFSVIELIIFIIRSLGGEVDFNIKSIFTKIKNLIKRRKDKTKDKDKYVDEDKRKKHIINIIEIVVLLVIAIAGLSTEPQFLDLTITNHVIKMLYIILVPLIIINIINGYIIEKDYEIGIFEPIGNKLFEFFTVGILGIAIASTVIIFSDIYDEYNYVNDNIKSLFVYNNEEYDEIRASDDFETEYDYLNYTFSNALSSLKANNDINDPNGYDVIKRNLFSQAGIKEYGYSVTDSVWQTDDIRIICVVDSKTREHKMYKLNYRNYSLEESSDKEFLSVKNAN